ncbi:MAG: hypothetical protein ACFHWZ_10790 [Phycisphaerales bacterium]
MAIKTFRGKSVNEALALVKRELGPNAVILHTKTHKVGGVFGIGAQSVTEITATADASVARSVQSRSGQRQTAPAERKQAGGAQASASAAPSHPPGTVGVRAFYGLPADRGRRTTDHSSPDRRPRPAGPAGCTRLSAHPAR